VATLVATGDLGWTAGSLVALARGLAWTRTGAALVLLVAAATAALGTFQAVAVVTLWRSRHDGDVDDPRPVGRPRLARRLRRGAALLGFAVGLLGGLYALLPWADLRSPEVRRPAAAADDSTAAERGRELLVAMARAHGLEALAGRRTMEVVARDEWAGRSPWWPAPAQRLRAERLLGTFTSRVELLDGPQAGEIRGIQSWQAYRQASSEAARELVADDPAMTFYLPTLQYFDELPFRLLEATVVRDAGPAELRGRRFRRLFVTWEKALPHARHDQYELWLDADTDRLEKVTYTVRDAASLARPWMRPLMRTAAIGTMHYGVYRSIDGVLVAFRQVVTLGTAADTPASLEESFFHRLTLESASFDTVEVATLRSIAGLDAPGDTKPR